MTYPRWQFALIGSKYERRFIRNPDDEEPAVWKESPADLPPLPPPEPKLPDCCQKLKAKFDVAWEKLQQEHTNSQASLEGFDAQWQTKVNENAAIQAELDKLKTAHDALKKLYGDLKAKHDALVSAATAEAQSPVEPEPTESPDAPIPAPETPDTAAKPRPSRKSGK